MSTLSLRLPNSLHDRLRELAAREGVSINQLITLAAAEKAASLLTLDYLEERAKAADLDQFDRLLARIPAIPPAPGDEMPTGAPRARTRLPAPAEVRERSAKYRQPRGRGKKKG